MLKRSEVVYGLVKYDPSHPNGRITDGFVDNLEAVHALRDSARRIFLRYKVKDIRITDDHYRIETNRGTFRAEIKEYTGLKRKEGTKK